MHRPNRAPPLLASLLLVAALLAPLLTPAPARALPNLTARELADLCEAAYAPTPTQITPAQSTALAARRQACAAYLDGVIGTISQLSALSPENTQVSDNSGFPGPAQKPAQFCVPDDEPVARLVKVFAAYVTAHRQQEDLIAAPIMVAAFGKAYPCR